MTTPYSGPEIEAAVKMLREDAILEHNSLVLARLDKVEERLGRMPTKEMSPEEKAAEYDRIVAERNNPPAPPAPNNPTPPEPPGTGNKPPAPAPKEPKTPVTGNRRRKWYETDNTE